MFGLAIFVQTLGERYQNRFYRPSPNGLRSSPFFLPLGVSAHKLSFHAR